MDLEYEAMLTKLNEIKKERDALYTKCKCFCDKKYNIRMRTVDGGAIHYVYQCPSCGQQKGTAISKKEALQELNGDIFINFDDFTKEKYYLDMQEEIKKLNSIENEILTMLNDLKPQPENTFLKSHKISEINSELSKLTSNYINTYGVQDVKAALNKEIEKIDKIQHSNVQDRIVRFKNEDELKKWLVTNFEKHFHIGQEVIGKHLIEGVAVRIDFVFKPREHLINAGFDPSPFGVEVKFFNPEDGFTHKTSRAFWQTISYNFCEFKLGNGYSKIKYCLLFSNFSFTKEFDLVKITNSYFENDQSVWNGMLHLANHANVGILYIFGQRESPTGWDIRFAGNVYFGMRLHDGTPQYKLSNNNVIYKKRLGNF